MSIVETVTADMKTAMKARDKQTLSVIRMLKAALMNEKVKVNHELTDEEAQAVIAREYKQRKESLDEFQKGNREDLVTETQAELKVVEKYMPKQLSQAEIEKIVATTIAEVGATGTSDFGKVMGAVMPKVKGKADGKLVNQAVKSQLS
ncbi:GatB/YqeY domain-containing protein [Pediococcus siamensis]|uniref:GatB/YqeY domain-containing protein n=1 Tax=Pediococcus siamensis TaxID=381829 RepID=UPI0039A309F0